MLLLDLLSQLIHRYHHLFDLSLVTRNFHQRVRSLLFGGPIEPETLGELAEMVLERVGIELELLLIKSQTLRIFSRAALRFKIDHLQPLFPLDKQIDFPTQNIGIRMDLHRKFVCMDLASLSC